MSFYKNTRYKNIYFTPASKYTTLFNIRMKATTPTEQDPKIIHVINHSIQENISQLQRNNRRGYYKQKYFSLESRKGTNALLFFTMIYYPL